MNDVPLFAHVARSGAGLSGGGWVGCGTRGESGQAMVWVILVVALVGLGLAVTTVGIGFLVAARAALAKATDAAALAVQEKAATVGTLVVPWQEWDCVAAPHGSGTVCSTGGGETPVPLAGGATFAGNRWTGAFGPDPLWAQAAGCAGTRIPPGAMPVGEYRICTDGQHVVFATASNGSAMVAVAQRWVSDNLWRSPDLTGAQVTAATLGAQGQVTVTVVAGLRPTLLWIRQITVTKSAWPIAG